MLVHRLSAPLKRILPGFLWRPIRRVGTAVLTPIYFSHHSGHFRSSLRARAVDRNRQPIPWYTYPCVEFLRDKTFTERDVLEFGSGQSTAWWAQRARRVVTFEADRDWYEQVRSTLASNVELHHVPYDLGGAAELIGDRRFDVIVVDGLDRAEACRRFHDRLVPGGVLLLDNADRYVEAMDAMVRARFSRIDFHGHAAGVILPHCTSLFFRDECFLLEGAKDDGS